MENFIDSALRERKKNNSLRSLQLKGDLIDFSSNDYLGFAQSEELRSSVEKELNRISARNGSTGSRLLTGNSEYAEMVEHHVASYHKAESALIYSTGYAANTGLISCIAKRGDTIIYDQLCHASIRDGIKLSNASSYAFHHNDLESLKQKLQRSKGNLFVIVESVYSMDGDSPELEEVVDICLQYEAKIVVDEAHAIGLIGEGGRGLVSSLNLEDKILARVVTFGKALGVHGAAVLGSNKLREYLVNFSRPFIYSTGPPQAFFVAVYCSYLALNELSIIKLNTSKLKKVFKLTLSDNVRLISDNENSGIIAVLCPGNSKAKEASLELENKGFDVRPILSPTVEQGGERLRVCFHEFNTRNEVKNLAIAISKIIA